MPDITGAVDAQVAHANTQLFMRLLMVLVIRAGGRLRFSPQDLRLVPPGTLAYGLEKERGGILLAWVPMPLFEVEKSKETTVIAMPDAPAADNDDAIERLCLGAFTLTNGSKHGIRIEAATEAESAEVNSSMLGRIDILGGGYVFFLERVQ